MNNIYLKIILILILLFLLGFLVLFFYWNKSYVFTDEEIENGEKEIQNSRIVFAGLIRDGENCIPYIQKRFENLGNSFKDYHILIVENDSQDKTREKLLEWQKQNPKVTILGCGINEKKCCMNLELTTSKTHNGKRIQKMALLRNLYINYINKNFRDWDYLVVNDLDLYADLSLKGWKSTFNCFQKDESLSAVSAYGYYDLWFKSIYYDDFAFVPLGKPIETRTEKIHDLGVAKHKLETEMYLLETKKEPVIVKSAFGGLTVYKISHILGKAEYDYCQYDNMDACEHSYFNQHLSKIIIHPGLKYKINKNNN